MRKFLELKTFMNENLKNEHLSFTEHDANFQIYRNGTDMNIGISGISEPVIKFEERQQGTFTVSVTYDDDCIIDYASNKNFLMSDNIVSLIDAFPNAYLIDNIVSSLLKIKYEL